MSALFTVEILPLSLGSCSSLTSSAVDQPLFAVYTRLQCLCMAFFQYTVRRVSRNAVGATLVQIAPSFKTMPWRHLCVLCVNGVNMLQSVTLWAVCILNLYPREFIVFLSDTLIWRLKCNVFCCHRGRLYCSNELLRKLNVKQPTMNHKLGIYILF